jgi:hypothetical protein
MRIEVKVVNDAGETIWEGYSESPLFDHPHCVMATLYGLEVAVTDNKGNVYTSAPLKCQHPVPESCTDVNYLSVVCPRCEKEVCVGCGALREEQHE